jgi:hypothetical protein
MTFGMNTNATYDPMNNFNAYARVIAKGTDIFMITADRANSDITLRRCKGKIGCKLGKQTASWC